MKAPVRSVSTRAIIATTLYVDRAFKEVVTAEESQASTKTDDQKKEGWIIKRAFYSKLNVRSRPTGYIWL